MNSFILLDFYFLLLIARLLVIRILTPLLQRRIILNCCPFNSLLKRQISLYYLKNYQVNYVGFIAKLYYRSCDYFIIKILFKTFMKVFLIVLICFFSVHTWKGMRRFQFINNCPQTIWVGGMGLPLISRTGWQMPSKTQYNLNVAANTVAIRFWARTGCKYINGQFKCDTGDCGAPLNNFGVECNGISGQSPATLVELTLSSTGGSDFYDVSNVDGNNLNVDFGPIPGTYQKVNNPDLGKYNCGAPACKFIQKLCPPQITLQTSSGSYCMSICAAVYNNQQVQKHKDILGPIASDDMKRDLVCCACGPNNGGCQDSRSHYCCSPLDPRKNIGGKCYVQDWPKPSMYFDRYDKVFKNQCGDAYSWQFDDVSSTYQCVDADYYVKFCP